MLTELEGEGSPGRALLLCKAFPNELQQGKMRTEVLIVLVAFGWGVL